MAGKHHKDIGGYLGPYNTVSSAAFAFTMLLRGCANGMALDARDTSGKLELLKVAGSCLA